MTTPDTCACCGATMTDLETIRTSDGRPWCPEHGTEALRLDRLSWANGHAGQFEMPGPAMSWARKQVQKNNRRRFGP